MFASIDEAGLFALAGGGAINVLQVSDRQTHDLDLFTPDAAQVNLLGGRLEAALIAEGLQVAVVRDSPGFMRLQVDDGSESTLIDLAQDARWLEPVSTQLGLVLDIRELAADKLCALFGRAEIRDLYDVSKLLDRFTLEEIVGWAGEKDSGFDVGVTIEMTERMKFRENSVDLSEEEFRRIQSGLIADLRRLESG